MPQRHGTSGPSRPSPCSSTGRFSSPRSSAPPMNLLGPELVRDLVSLIQRAEADDAYKVLVFKSGDPDYFISHVDLTRVPEYRQEAAKLTGVPSIALAVPPPEREPPRHHRPDRGSGPIGRAASSCWPATCASRRASRPSSPVRGGVRSDPGRRCDPVPRSAHGSRPRPRGAAERRGLRRRSRRTIRLDQPRLARRCSWAPSFVRSPSASRDSRPPACHASRTASTRSRWPRRTTSVAIPISSARRCTTSRPNADSEPPCVAVSKTRDAEMPLRNHRRCPRHRAAWNEGEADHG